MTYMREPVLQPVPIESLRPTQITVGMREVEEKRKHLRKQKPQKIGAFIGHHMIPVVLGPKKRHYVIDHHHLSLALHKEGLTGADPSPTRDRGERHSMARCEYCKDKFPRFAHAGGSQRRARGRAVAAAPRALSSGGRPNTLGSWMHVAIFPRFRAPYVYGSINCISWTRHEFRSCSSSWSWCWRRDG
jgi:hypothetical protein